MEQEEATHLWGWVQNWLEREDRSAAYLGKLIGVTRAEMTRWKKGQGKPPTPEELERLAAIIRVPYAQLREAVLLDLGYGPSGSVEDEAG